MTTIKITQLTDIGANLASTTVLPVVNMAGTPTTEKTVLGNIANVVLAGAGGNYVAAAKATTATTANTVLTAAQPNITSTGNLTGLTVSNATGVVNFSNTANVTLGAVGNLHISGGTANYVLKTDGAGNLSWVAQSGGSNGVPGGSNTQVQFNDAGAFAGNTGFTFDNTTGILTSPFVAGNGNGLSNIQGANVSGAVSYATTANAVAGANVSGAVSFATTANAVAAANVSGLGNLALLSKDGNASNILYGNGVFASVPNPFDQDLNTTDNVQFANVTSTEAVKFSNSGNIVGAVGYAPTYVSIESYGSNTVNITANDIYTWSFDNTGNLNTPGDIVGPANANITIYANAGVHEFIFGDDGTFYAPDNVVLGGNSIYIGPGANTLNGIEHEVFIASSNLFPYVQAVVNNISDNGSADWVALGARGGDTGGQASLGFTSSGFGDANYTITGNGDGYVLVQSYAPGQTLLGGGGNLVLATGNQGSVKDIIFGTGGFLTANTFGRISHSNNSLELTRTGASLTFPDGSIQTTAYTGGGGSTGNVTFDDVTIQGVNGLNLSAGSDFTANLAYLQVRAGDVASHIHLDTGNNQAYDLIVGDDQNYVQVSSTGNILLSSYDSNTAQYTWTLDYNGNLILAGGNSVIQSIANSSLDPTLPNVSTMVLTPDPGYSSQALVLDPTAPGHIHLRSTASSNIDEPNANLFLGGEDTAFEITSGANNEARIHSGNLTWTFSNTSGYGVINFPGESYLRSNDDTINIQSYDTANGVGRGIYIGSSGGLYFWDGNSQSVSIQQDNTDANITAIGNTSITSNVYTWTFDNDGTLTLPGNLVYIGASPAPSISGFNSVSAEEFTNDTSNVTINANSNTWNFDSTGNLTIPSTSGGFIKTASNASIGIVAMDNGTNNPAQLLSMNVGNGNATSIVSAYSTNVAIQTNASGAINTWQFDNAGNLTLPANTFAINYANGTQVSIGGSSSNISNGNSNVNIATANGNVTIAAVGNTTMTITGTGANITGTANISGNIITGAQIQSTAFTGGNISWSTNNQTDFQGAIKVGGTGVIKGPGGASSITLNNNGANVPILGVTNTGNSTSTTTGALIVSGGAGVAGNIYAGGNINAAGVGTNMVRRANTISGSNTVVTLDNLTALVGGSPTRLYIGAASSNMTMAGTSQTMVSGSIAVSSWINLPIATGVGNGFAVSGAISSAGDTVVLNITDQGAGSGTWRVTGMIANTTANLYSVSIERLS